MAIRQISVESANKVKLYNCLPTDLYKNYPTASDCAEGSIMVVNNATTGLPIQYLKFNGVKWEYIKSNSEISDIVYFNSPMEVDNEFLLDFENKPSKKFYINIEYKDKEKISLEVDETAEVTAGGTALVTFASSLVAEVVIPVTLVEDDAPEDIAEKITLAMLENADIADNYDVTFEDNIVYVENLIKTHPDESLVFSLSAGDVVGLLDTENYVEEVIPLEEAKTVTVSNVPNIAEATLIINMDADTTISFDANIEFSEIPDMSYGKTYVFNFITVNGGYNWQCSVLKSLDSYKMFSKILTSDLTASNAIVFFEKAVLPINTPVNADYGIVEIPYDILNDMSDGDKVSILNKTYVFQTTPVEDNEFDLIATLGGLIDADEVFETTMDEVTEVLSLTAILEGSLYNNQKVEVENLTSTTSGGSEIAPAQATIPIEKINSMTVGDYVEILGVIFNKVSAIVEDTDFTDSATLLTAINSQTLGWTATLDVDDSVTVTADDNGVENNDLTFTITYKYTIEGGEDATKGEDGEILVDETNLYVNVGNDTWKKLVLQDLDA